ncbi:hypothetical protein [Chroococcidiopsis sp. CCMEE 29]|uniref:hypothetical protein n=1 Tax=Chroococcidiopsis sp. CCMEE 29 TaxID=155894 RepID=UPI002022653C|nr:hypothetical protein [Chroococcidiopsis sp. CCMEE 29]
MARRGGNPDLYSKRVGEELMAENPLTVRVPLSIDSFVRSLPNRTEWLRKAIADAYEREVQHRK